MHYIYLILYILKLCHYDVIRVKFISDEMYTCYDTILAKTRLYHKRFILFPKELDIMAKISYM